MNDSINPNDIVSPLYVTGITDGEGSFQITIKDNQGKGLTGFKPFLEFKITQKKHSIDMLKKIKKFSDCGRISIDNRKSGTIKYVVTKNEDLVTKIIPHFDIYPLVTSKYLNYSDFKSAALCIKEKSHFTIKGIQELRNIKLKMNKNRSIQDKFNYCWSKPINLYSNWVQGFIDGEGSFQCEFHISKSKKKNIIVNFSLQINQNNHDIAVLDGIKKFFRAGYFKPKYDIKDINYCINSRRKTTAIWIRDTGIICKFLDKYPLYTMKNLDYFDWKRLINLKAQSAHHTKEGLAKMLEIRKGMNKNRRF